MRRVDISNPEFKYRAGDPEGFRSGMYRLGPMMEAKDTGTTIYELPPGQAVCPYHYEYGEEEWAMVLEGRATVRTPEGTEELGPNEIVFFETGPTGAHQIRNDTDSTVRVLMWSPVVYPTITAYPDSDKVGAYTGVKGESLIARRSGGVDYFDGETA